MTSEVPVRRQFPFAAIVGQEELKTALMVCAVDSTAGGVLIRGDKGTAKSTAARGLAELLPPIAKVKGCQFNCVPGEHAAYCDTCADGEGRSETVSVPFINLPLGATEDRVLGSLDFERALKEGRRSFQPGLLAAGHRGIIYVDEINLLPDHLVDVLLDAAAMGENSVQREGLSITHPARITLIGTMNLEEGDLRPQLLDRFGMMVEVKAPNQPDVRTEVVRRRIAFEAEPQTFRDRWKDEQLRLRRQIDVARDLLPTVSVSDAILDFISTICCELGVTSLRADIIMHKVVRALAALGGRTAVLSEDVRVASQLVLPHRRRRKPSDRSGLDQEKLQRLMERLDDRTQNVKDDLESPEPGSEEQKNEESQEEVFSACSFDGRAQIQIAGQQLLDGSGRRARTSSAQRGAFVRAVEAGHPASVAVTPTIVHSIVRNQGILDVTADDLHGKERAGKVAGLTLFVVDSSGSMAAIKRMELVKGAVLSLLSDAYEKRDDVGVIAFRGSKAELLLSPTRSTDVAEQRLQELPTGGRTPLADALELALTTIAASSYKKEVQPILVLLTDGRANVAITGGGDAWQDSLSLAQKIAERGYQAIVIDTETGAVKLGRAHMLAQIMEAEYLPIEKLSAEDLFLTLRSKRQRGAIGGRHGR